MNRVEIQKKLISKSFYTLKEKERIIEYLFLCVQEPDIDVVIRGGLNDDFIYGIVLEIYKVKPKQNARETPPVKTSKCLSALEQEEQERIDKSKLGSKNNANANLGCAP